MAGQKVPRRLANKVLRFRVCRMLGGMTVSEMVRRMPARELVEWGELLRAEAVDSMRRQKAAEAKAKREHAATRGRGRMRR